MDEERNLKAIDLHNKVTGGELERLLRYLRRGVGNCGLNQGRCGFRLNVQAGLVNLPGSLWMSKAPG